MKAYIKTNRLVLRNFKLEDASSAYENYCFDEVVTRYVTWYPHASLDVTIQDLKTRVLPMHDSDCKLDLAITTNQHEDEVIGNIAASIEETTAEIGYVLSRRFWNKGYMTEAFAAMIAYLFTNTKVNKVIACFEKDNVASGKVMENGLTYQKDILEQRKFDSDKNDVATCALYQITKEEWKKGQSLI